MYSGKEPGEWSPVSNKTGMRILGCDMREGMSPDPDFWAVSGRTGEAGGALTGVHG